MAVVEEVISFMRANFYNEHQNKKTTVLTILWFLNGFGSTRSLSEVIAVANREA